MASLTLGSSRQLASGRLHGRCVSQLGVSTRCFSMPSRADTRPFAFSPVGAAGLAAPVSHWSGRFAAGLFVGPRSSKLRDAVKRKHALSPLVPTETALATAIERLNRTSPAPAAGETAAIATISEHTLSAVALGTAAVCVVRGTDLVAFSAGGSIHAVVQPGDTVGVVLGAWSQEELVAAAAEASQGEGSRPSLWLSCGNADASEVWSLDTLETLPPHGTWVKTVFNEYGDHNATE